MNITAHQIQSFPNYFDDIIALNKINTQTLGFLPREAFIEKLKNNQLIIAIDNGSKLCGYLLYDVNKSYNFIYIVHLCTKNDCRRKGIARILFNYLVDNTKRYYRGIRVTCRVDYDATEVWRKLGFVCKAEKNGRSKVGSKLFIWWFDYGHENLFSDIRESDKIKVALDSNIIYDLKENINEKNKDSHALLDDWLINDVEYCITEELHNDISKHSNAKEREESRSFISTYSVVKSSNDNFFFVNDELKLLFNKKLNHRDEADI